MVYSALAVALMAGEPCLVPIYAQDKAMQAMTLTALYNLADQQSQKVRVSEVALQAASEGVAGSQIGFAAQCGFEPSRQLYGQCLHAVARFFDRWNDRLHRAGYGSYSRGKR